MAFNMKPILFAAVAATFLYSTAGNTQTAEAEKAQEDQQKSEQAIQITGVKDPDWKPYKVMVKGLDAFKKFQSFSPAAVAKFILKPRKEEVSLQGISLKMVVEGVSSPIPFDADGVFDLPRDENALQKNAELVINSKKSLYRWWPHVRSPQLAANQRRLGDLRIECEMFWAIYYDDIPFLVRNPLRMMGGPCKSTKVMMHFPSDYLQIKEATLIQNGKHFILPISKSKTNYYVPIFNQDYSNDAIIQIEYEENSGNKKNYNGIFAGVRM